MVANAVEVVMNEISFVAIFIVAKLCCGWFGISGGMAMYRLDVDTLCMPFFVVEGK